MRRQVLRQQPDVQPQDGIRRTDVLDQAREFDRFKGRLWLRFHEAAAYTGRPTVRAFYSWRDRHGIVAHRDMVKKADLDRVLNLRKGR